MSDVNTTEQDVQKVEADVHQDRVEVEQQASQLVDDMHGTNALADAVTAAPQVAEDLREDEQLARQQEPDFKAVAHDASGDLAAVEARLRLGWSQLKAYAHKLVNEAEAMEHDLLHKRMDAIQAEPEPDKTLNVTKDGEVHDDKKQA